MKERLGAAIVTVTFVVLLFVGGCKQEGAASSPSGGPVLAATPTGASSTNASASSQGHESALIPVMELDVALATWGDTVFIGTPVRLHEERVNTSRYGKDLGPDPYLASLHRVYEVNVERYLKGNEGSTVNIILDTEKELQLFPDEPGKEPVQLDRGYPAPIPPALGKRYLFFAMHSKAFPGLLGAAPQPGFFRLENGMAVIEGDWAWYLAKQYPPKPEAEFLQEVEAAIGRNP